MDLKKLSEDIKQYKKNIADTSIKFYVSTFNNIIKRSGLNFNYSKDFFKHHTNDLIEYIQTLKSDQTKKNALAVLIVVYKAYGGTADDCQDFTKEILNITDKLSVLSKTHTKTEKQADNMITLEKIKNEIMPYLKAKTTKNEHITTYNDYINFMKYYLMLFYTEQQAPLRNDWAGMELLELKDDQTQGLDKTKNYIIYLSKSKQVIILLNVYKTSKTHGTIKINIDNKDLIILTKRLLQILPKFSKSKCILVKHNGEAMSENGLTKFFNSIFKHWDVSISTTMLRHIVISDSPLYNKQQLKEQEDREELARRMGHTVDTAFTQYAKE